MSEVSFKAQIKNLNSDYIKLIFEQKTAADTAHSLVIQKTADFAEDTFTLLKNGKETASCKSEFIDVDSKQSLDKLFSIFQLLKIKEAKEALKKYQKKPKKSMLDT